MQTESNYESMMATFREVRQQLSGDLIALNTAGVTELTEGSFSKILRQSHPYLSLRSAIREVSAIGLEAMEWTDEASGDEHCLDNAIGHWEEEKVNIGISLSSCVDQFSAPIVNATENLLDFITEHSQIAFEAQHSVLNSFVEVS